MGHVNLFVLYVVLDNLRNGCALLLEQVKKEMLSGLRVGIIEVLDMNHKFLLLRALKPDECHAGVVLTATLLRILGQGDAQIVQVLGAGLGFTQDR